MSMSKPRPPVSGRRRGLTLIEAALVLGVLTAVMGGIAQVLSDTAENQRSKAAADRMTEVLQASQQYIRANQTVLTTLTTSGSVLSVGVAATTAGGSDPGGPSGSSLPSLQGGGFLPSTYLDVDAYGQNHKLVIKQVATGTANAHLEGMVVSTGGFTIPDRQVGRAARFVGAQGGFMASSPVSGTAAQITGVGGGWITPASAWSASGVTPTKGHLMAALSINDNALAGDYLNRYNIGVPEANTLHTDVHFGGNNIDNINQICASATGTIGGACNLSSANLTIGPNITIPGYLHAGQEVTSGTYVSAAGDVDAGGNLNASGSLNVSGNGTVAGTVYTSGIVDYGNATVNGTAQVGYLRSSDGMETTAGNVTADNGSVVANNGNVYANNGSLVATNGNVVIQGSGQVYVSNGNIGTAQGDLNATNGRLYVNNTYDDPSYIQDLQTSYLGLDSVVYSNGDSRGLTTGDGIHLGDLLPHTVAQYMYVTSESSPYVPKPTCGSGGTPKIIFNVMNDSMAFTPYVISNYLPGGSQIGYTEYMATSDAQRNNGGIYIGNVPVYGTFGLAYNPRGGTTYTARNIAFQDMGSVWQLVVAGNNRGDLPVTGNSQTYCFYP